MTCHQSTVCEEIGIETGKGEKIWGSQLLVSSQPLENYAVDINMYNSFDCNVSC